jgi:NitT/TauT family transport system substrate-binding protein
MIKSKKIFVVFIICCLMVSFSACLSVKDTATNSRQVLNIGAIASIDVVPIVIADQQGFFKEENVDVHFEPFKSSKDRDAAFQAGNLDGMICDQVAVCLYQNGGFDIKITGITDGDFMLVAGPNSGVQSIEDLRGKSVAISEKTAIEYTLDLILEKNHISPTEVKKSIVPAVPARLEMLRNHKVDVALLPEPFSTLAIKDGGILLGSASKLASYPSVIVFKQQSIDAKADEIKAFYRAYNKAVDYINNTPLSEYEDIVMNAAGYPEDMKGMIILPKFRKNVLPPEDEIKTAIDWTTKNGLIQKTLNPKDLLNDIGIK